MFFSLFQDPHMLKNHLYLRKIQIGFVSLKKFRSASNEDANKFF